MANIIASIPNHYWSGATPFRDWGTQHRAILTALGLVQTADTGQINWTTANPPNNTYTTAGYEVYRFDDALQATVPIFIRITYGSNQYANHLYSTWRVGSGTDGAGNLTGLLSTQFNVNLFDTNSTWGADTCYGAGDGSGLWVALHATASSYPNGRALVVLDRFRNADGTRPPR